MGMHGPRRCGPSKIWCMIPRKLKSLLRMHSTMSVMRDLEIDTFNAREKQIKLSPNNIIISLHPSDPRYRYGIIIKLNGYSINTNNNNNDIMWFGAKRPMGDHLPSRPDDTWSLWPPYPSPIEHRPPSPPPEWHTIRKCYDDMIDIRRRVYHRASLRSTDLDELNQHSARKIRNCVLDKLADRKRRNETEATVLALQSEIAERTSNLNNSVVYSLPVVIDLCDVEDTYQTLRDMRVYVGERHKILSLREQELREGVTNFDSKRKALMHQMETEFLKVSEDATNTIQSLKETMAELSHRHAMLLKHQSHRDAVYDCELDHIAPL
eukprot:GHVO01023775.1.p1 GENE.GHVO01023775.1~~GHVO01023775.1.p1  ORF type:complete len:323 (-),score=54.80 GHVO01023775.1:43-1011(-)